MKLGRLLGFLAIPAALAALPGCAFEATTPTIDGYATVYADTVPVDVYGYPRVWYGGRYVYLVGDRWYSPYGRGWVVLRAEPPTLYRYRTTYQAAPYYRGRPAVRAVPPRYGYPSERRWR